MASPSERSRRERRTIPLASRIIPDRTNRSLMWLILLTSASLAVSGAILGSLVVYGVYDVPIRPVLANLLLSNLVAIAVGAVITAAALRGSRPVIRARGAVGFGALMAGSALVVKIIIVAIVGVGPRDRMGPVFFSVIVMTGFLLFVTLVAAVLYAASRERALNASYVENAGIQAALAHEEEAVRAHVFDQLHGTLQAEFVAMRRVLDDLAHETTDPRAAEVATELDARLERVYRNGVESIARVLSPSAIEGGLQAAVAEMAVRLAGACEITVEFDAIATAFDDPMTGGMRRDIRVAAYRVIEEAVSNAIRHASARQSLVRVSSILVDGRPALVLDIENACVERPSIIVGEGLRRMRSRVEVLGGTLVTEYANGLFVVRAEIPLQRAQG